MADRRLHRVGPDRQRDGLFAVSVQNRRDRAGATHPPRVSFSPALANFNLEYFRHAFPRLADCDLLY
jgi:hypothetical protein